MTDSSSPYAAGATVTLLGNGFTAPAGNTFNGWVVTDASSNNVEVSNNQFTMPASNVTVMAQWVQAAGDYITVSPTTKELTCAASTPDFTITTDQDLDTDPTQFYTTVDGNVTTSKPDWITGTLYDEGTLLLSVAANTGIARTAYFRVEKGSVRSDVITITQAAFTVEPPSFDPDSGTTFTSDDVVELSCTTPNATIYYTMGDNPADPTNASTEYDPSEGIEVTESTTIKAIAYVGDVASAVSTATYTVVHPFTTMDEIFAASATPDNYYVTLDNWVVSGVSGNQAFVTDGTKGFIIYKSGHGFSVGNVLSGTVQAALTKYKGSAEFTNLTSSTTGLTVTTGGTITPQEVSISSLSGENTGAVIKINNVTYDGTYLEDAGSNTIKPYNTLYNSMSFTSSQKYNVTGVYLQFEDTKEILPRSAADIVEVNDPAVAASSSSLAVPNYLQGTPVGDITSQGVNVSGLHLTDDVLVELENGSSSNFELYDADNDEWTDATILSPTNGTLSSTAVLVRLKAGKSAGNYSDKLVISSTGATTVEVDVTGSVTTASVTYDANGADDGDVPTDATGYAYNGTVTVLGNTGNLTKAHNTFDGWNTEADGTGTTYAAGATFSITDDVTLYAKWTANTNTVTLPANDTYGTYSMEPSNPVAYGTEVTLTYTPASGYENYAATWSVNDTPISGNKFDMPDEAVTITVSVEEVLERTLSIDFESAASAYTDWTFTNMTSQQTGNSNVSGHNSSTNYGTTGGKASASIETNATIANPKSLTCYVTKQTDNTNASTWYIKVKGEKDSDWTTVETKDAAAVTKGTWSEFTADLSSYSDVYVGVFYSGSTAVRNIDDLTLTYEIDANSASITANPTSLSLDAESHNGSISVTWTNISSDQSIYWCDDNGVAATYDWISASINGTTHNVDYNVEENNSGYARTAYLKVHGVDGSNADVYSSLVTISQSKATVNYTLASSLTPGKKYIIASGSEGSVKVMGSQGSNNRAAVTITNEVSGGVLGITDEAVTEFVVYGPDANDFYTLSDGNSYLYANGSDKNNYLKSQTINSSYGKWDITIDSETKAATVVGQGDNSNKYMRFNSTLFSCYGSGSSIVAPVYFYEKADAAVATTASVTLNGYGYATFATTNALDFLDADAENVGYSAWQITGANSSTGVITFTQIKEHVVAGTGILLKGTASTPVNLNILPVGGATLGDNILVGATSAVHLDAAGEAYGLSGNKFVKNSGAGDIPAGKAYIPYTSLSSSVKAFTFVFEGEDDPTGIETTDNGLQTTDDAIYNLAGQRIQKVQKGINIVNGKKVLK